MKSLKNKILIFQTDDEVAAAKELFGAQLDDFSLIAWTPIAVDGLRKHGLDFLFASNYLDQSDRLGDAFTQCNSFKAWTDLFDRYLQEAFPEIARLKIRPCYHAIHSLKALFFRYFDEIDKLYALVKNGSCVTIHLFYYAKSEPSMLSRLLDVIPRDELWNSKIIRLNPRRPSLQGFGQISDLVSDQLMTNGPLQKMKRKLGRIVRYGNLKSFLAGSVSRSNHCKTKNILVLSSPLKDLQAVLEELKCHGSYQYIFLDASIEKEVLADESAFREAAERFKRDERSHGWTLRRGIDIFDLCMPETERFLRLMIPQYIKKVTNFISAHQKNRIDFVIASEWHPFWEAIFDQCVYLKIPAAIWLHGGTIGHFKEFPDPTYLRRFDPAQQADFYFFVYSEAIAHYLDKIKDIFPDSIAQNYAIGSLSFDELIQKHNQKIVQKKEPLRICYVSGPIANFTGNHNRSGSYDDVVIYDMRHRLLEIFQGNQKLVVQFKYGYSYKGPELECDRKIREGIFSNIHPLPSNKKFSECLDSADLFIIERPSTVLYEALSTSKPIVAFLDEKTFPMTEEANQLLKNRVTMVSSQDEMIRVAQDISQNLWDAQVFLRRDHADHRFIKKFAISGAPNQVADAVRILKNLLNPGMQVESQPELVSMGKKA